MGKVANADLRRRNVLAEVAHVRVRCQARWLTWFNFLKPYFGICHSVWFSTKKTHWGCKVETTKLQL